MSTKIFYIEIMTNEFRKQLESKRKKSGKKLIYVEFEIEAGQGAEKKKLFSLTLDEIKELFSDSNVNRKAFKIYGITNKEVEKVPSRIKKKLFETVYLGK